MEKRTMKTIHKSPKPHGAKNRAATLYFSFSVLLLFVGLLSGCVREEAELGSGAGRVLTVHYSFDQRLTRAAATDIECKVRDVALFFYNADDAHPANETYVGCQAVSVPKGSGAPHSFPLPLPDGIIPGNRYKLIIIGNYNAYPPEGKSPAAYAEQYKTRTYSQMAQDIQGQLASDRTRVTPPLPFLGRLLGQDGNETTLTGPPTTATELSVSVKFSRAVARFNVTNLAADRLKIAWAKVCNYRTCGYFFRDPANAGSIARGTSATPPLLPFPPGYVAAPEPTGTPGTLRQDLSEGGMYAFPNIASYTLQDDSVTTCLLLAGYYQDPAAATPNTTRLTYYRLNIGKNGSTQFLRRNYVYTAVINGVKQEGAATEEDAMNEKEQLTDYNVDNDNESGNSGTVADNLGNFLTLSRTSVTLGNEKGANALITVSVNKGASWTLAWKNNADNAFRFEKVNDTGFSIFTTGKNETVLARNAALTVSVEGLTAPLELTVSATQRSTLTDPQLLTVDGKQGAFDYAVSARSTQIALPVVTGSPTSKWKAEADADLSGFVSSFTPEGANKGVLSLSFPTNLGAPRQGTLTVKRLLPDGNEDTSVAPVGVTFKQDGHPIVTLDPDYSASGLTIDGFQAEKGIINGIAKNVRFKVLLSDPAHYKFYATSSFNGQSDAFIGKSENTHSTASALKTSVHNPISIVGMNGEDIWLCVFRTGPGDPDIKGTLVVKALPKDPATASQYPPAIYTVNITITTSCKIGDSRIGTTLWADRNVGATPRGIGGAAVGLNYSKDDQSDDHANTGFQGNYYDTYSGVSAACATFGATNKYEGELATGWRTFSFNEGVAAANRMYFSKQRAYIVSDDKTKGMVGCWFPLSGRSDSPDDISGEYRGEVVPNANNCITLYPNIAHGPYFLQGWTKSDDMLYGTSVRCVRDINPVVPTSGDL